MPKSEINKKFFAKLSGLSTDRETLEAVLPYAKAEFDGEDNENLKIEFNDTNRPDLWSIMGLVRQLKTVRHGLRKTYSKFFSSIEKSLDNKGREFIVDKSRPEQRPYSVGFCVNGKKIDDFILRMLIEVQEKIHQNYGRKRRSISLGLYRSNEIKFPVIFKGADPDSNSYIPLHESREMTLREVLNETEKGKEYGYIIKDYEKFPYLVDSSGKTLSMPPIINSNDVGALKIGDSNIFIEINGVYLKQVLLVANILACDFIDLGFDVLPVKVKFPEDTEFGREITVPFYFQNELKVTDKEVERLLGPGFSMQACVKCLNRMGVQAKAFSKFIRVTPPPYRNDFLDVSDVIEDIAIGYGLDNFDRENLNDFTVGRLLDAEEYQRKIQKIFVGLGFNEMIFNYLSSKEEYVDNMLVSDEDVIYISNPMSQNFKTVRPSIIPSLLKAESSSQSAVYPHKMFETGKICKIDESKHDGTATINSLGVLESSVDANFNKAVSILNTLFYYLFIDYKLEKIDDVRFIKGRAASVVVNGDRVGVIGEVNPEVLEKWQVAMPSYAIEINLDLLLQISGEANI